MHGKTQSSPTPRAPHKLLQRSVLLLLACVDIYALGLIIYFLARLATGFRLWPVALFSNFLHLALLPVLVFLPITLCTRHWPGIVVTGLCALAFAWLYGGLFLPQRNMECGSLDGCTHIRVMTFNLGSDLAEATPERVSQVIRDSDADLVALQEVNAAHADAIRRGMTDIYPYQTIYAAGEGTLGIALISRYPIIEERQFSGSITWLPYLEADISIDGRHLSVLNAHPAPPGWSLSLRRMYFSRSLDDMRQFAEMAGEGPTLLMGDFNVADQSADYHILAQAGLIDAYRATGFGFGLTYPTNRWYGYTNTPSTPLVRIDYIWHTFHFTAARAWVGQDAGSDHLPVIAELIWPAENQAGTGTANTP